ncbi:phosphoribosylamine--glycine ligase [Thiospirochaeta perfilievii]|uniref:Phosphoribosylamine--glycine ligase n=1 Tax=Thiospirochaeta perfilievii TaxID=252967 RepID=A0A5C1Q9Y5_9SPIO|nr:phosphoribosylamine--glycine ligase [Thiospirochaeta perfilievii]QEN03606.1 phosphoribosylamine--glycine ligase [Thiospirochaeta perfilievii]
MRVLVIGSGAREHAATWKFSKSKRISGLFVAPGNAGTDEIAKNIDIDVMNSQSVIDTVKANKINFVFIGPEIPLANGLADDLRKNGINCFGPGREAAQLESSKSFSKAFMKRNNIPTADYDEFSNKEDYTKFIQNLNKKVVVKKSGLAAGKGVLESEDKDEMLAFGLEALNNDKVVVEEFLEGFEVSIFVLSDGKNYKILQPCTDHKKAYDGDKGPNTGGMGAITPVPWVDSKLMQRIEEEAVIPTINGLNRDSLNYKGVIYIGLMISEEGPKVLEYNVRFGDPEAQIIFPTIESDFCNIMDAITEESLDDYNIRLSNKSAVCITVAAKGYPGSYTKDLKAEVHNLTEKEGYIFHASTYLKSDDIYTNGGRCFTAVSTGENTLDACENAYKVVKKVSFPGSWYRKDIARKFFK